MCTGHDRPGVGRAKLPITSAPGSAGGAGVPGTTGPAHVGADLGRAEGAVVDAHLVDEAVEALAPDVVGAEGQRAALAGHERLGQRAWCRPGCRSRTGAASCCRRSRPGGSTCRDRGRSCRGRRGRRPRFDARHVGVAVRVERVGEAAGRLLEDDRAPVRGGLRPHPGLERQRPDRSMRSPSGTVAMSSSPSNESARPKRPALLRVAPPDAAVVAAALVDDRRAGGLLESVRRHRRARRRCRRSGCRGPTRSLPPLPSSAVTSTATASPESPLPGSARSSVRPVAPLMAVPFRNHW